MAFRNGMEQRGKTTFLLCTIFLLLLGILFFTNADPYFLGGVDQSHYAGAARSLINGAGYTFNGRPETCYPPGLSLSLAGIIDAFGDNYIFFSRYIVICAILSLIFTFLYYKLRQVRHGIIFCIIIACSPTFFIYSTEVGSDMVFMMASMGYLYFSELANNRKNDPHRKYFLILAGLFLLYAVSTRSIGMALVAATGAVMIHSLYINRKKLSLQSIDHPSLIYFAIGFVFYAYWSYWSYINTTTLYENEFRESYFRQLLLINPHQPDLGNAPLFSIFLRFLNNIPSQIAHIAEYFANVSSIKPLWLSPLTIFSLFIAAKGLAIELRRPHPLAGWYVVFYFALVLVWPYDEGKRFIFPVLPIIAILLLQGIHELTGLFQKDFASIKKYILYISIFCLTGSVFHFVMAKPYSKQEFAFILLWCLIIISLHFSSKIFNVFSRLRQKRLTSFAALFYILLFLIFSNFLIVSNIMARSSHKPDYPLATISHWIQNNIASSSTIMSHSSAQIYYLTGREILPLPITGNADILSRTMYNLKPDYLIIDVTKHQYEYYRPTEEERFRILERIFPGGFKKEFGYKDISVYRVQL